MADMSALGEFRLHRDRPGRQLHVSRPERDAATGEWRAVMSRRIETPDGRFAGAVLATLDPAFLKGFHRHADIGARGMVTLVSLSGFALARYASGTSTYGVDMRNSTLLTQHAASPSGSFVSVGKIDGVSRLFSYRGLAPYPLIVAVGTAREDALAAVNERRTLYCLLAGLGSCVLALVAAAAVRWMTSQKRYVALVERAQDQSRASEARCRAITESMAGGVVTTDTRGTILSVNSAACGMYGYGADEMVGRPIAMLVHESGWEHLAAVFEELNAREGGFKEGGREFLSIRKGGTCFEVEVLISTLAIGGTRSYIGIVHDISARKGMERELRSSESRLRATFDQALVGIAYADLEGRFTRVNQAFCDMLGYAQAELLERGYADILEPADRNSTRERVQDLLDEPSQPFSRQVARCLRRKNGAALWVLSSVSRIREADGVPGYYVGMIQDITELKRVERMKSEFVSTVSHELRTPLTSIHGSLGLLAAGLAGELPAAARNLTAIAARNCERLIRLVNDILDTERIESGKMTFELAATDLRTLVRNAIESNDGFARQHGIAVTLAEGGRLHANVDSDRFTQVVTNLLSNAVKFSPPGGIVEVTLGECDGMARLEVRDHGPGIPQEFQDRIFQRFAQADASDSRKRGGSGLGLSIAKGIVERLGGTIGFATAGTGTTFSVRLPLAAAPAAAGVTSGA
jgi:PAS domain S-box-containing protein